MVEKYKGFEIPFFGCIFWMRIKAFKRRPIIKTFPNLFFFFFQLYSSIANLHATLYFSLFPTKKKTLFVLLRYSGSNIEL